MIGKLNYQREYWMKELNGMLPNPSLLQYMKKTEQGQNKRERIEITIKGGLFDLLMKIGKQSDISIYLILLTNLKALLYRYTEEEDSVVASPVYLPNNNQENDNDYVIIHNEINGNMSFKECIIKVKEKTIEAYKNQNYLFKDLVEQLNAFEESNKWQLLNTVCLLKNIHSDKGVEDTRNNIVFAFNHEDNQLTGNIVFNANLFDRDFIQQFKEHYVNLLEAALVNLDEAISSINLVSPEEIHQLVVKLNDTTVDYNFEENIHNLFEKWARENPDRIGVAFEDQSITYADLNNKANQLANILKNQGVGKGDYVPVLMENSLELVIALLAIMKTGGAFVPLDVQWPMERIKNILDDLDSKIVLVNKKDSKYNEDNLLRNLLIVDAEQLLEDTLNLDISVSAEDTIYVIYTSGSTGKPKGVIVPHKGIINRFLWMNDYFKVSSSKSVLKTTNHVYDSAVWQIFWPLINGGMTVIPSADTIISADVITTIVEKYQITMMDFVPSVFNIIVQQLLENKGRLKDKLASLQNIVVGGEEIVPFVVYKFLNLCPSIKITNLYGPTEASIGCIFHQVTGGEGDKIPIGRPLSNVKILILNEEGKIAPMGMIGEIYISGICLATGYLNDQEKTNKVFIDNLFPEIDHPKLYKTGDLAYYGQNGDIYFCGRADHQVKIRGLRIELGEIENQLMKQEAIKDAVVIVHSKQNNSKILCAYIVADRNIEVSKVKNGLQEVLPDYMIPSVFIEIDKIPLNSSGKVDRKSLQSRPIQVVEEVEYLAPSNDVEEKLQKMWEEILGVEKIGMNNDFFELGGDSLKAITLVSKIHKEFNVEVSLRQIFATSTARDIANTIMQGKTSVYSSIQPCGEKAYYSVSPAQKRLYILQQMNVDQTSYNISGVKILEGSLDQERLEKAFRTIIKRHEALRTSFEFVKGELVQRIHEDVEFNIIYKERKFSKGDPWENHAESIIDDFVKPFNLGVAPSFRVGVVKVDQDKFLLIFDIHHIVADGVSMGILMNEFARLYAGVELPEVKIQYKDFSEWQHNLHEAKEFKKQEEYWLERFSGEIPKLDIRTDFPRPLIRSFEGDAFSFKADKELTGHLKKLTEKSGVTLYMLLLAAYNVLLSKWTNQEDILVGLSTAGRPHIDLSNTIGMFVNTLVMRNTPLRDKTFSEFLETVKDSTLRAFENQDYQFDDIIEKLKIEGDLSRTPMFDTMFTLQNIEFGKIEIEGLTINSYDLNNKIAKFDINLNAMEENDMIIFDWEYSTKLFKRETIDTLAKGFMNVLNCISENPDIKLKDIEPSLEEINAPIVVPIPSDFNDDLECE